MRQLLQLYRLVFLGKKVAVWQEFVKNIIDAMHMVWVRPDC